jgi:hypothetical protein
MQPPPLVALALVGFLGCGGGAGVMGDDDTGDDASADASVPQTVKITFDDLTDRTDVATQYAAHATFSTDTGQDLQARAFADLCETSSPMNLNAGPSGEFTAPVYVDFKAPAYNLEFTAACLQTAPGAHFATAHLVRKDQTDMTIDLISAGYTTPLDLSSYGAITRLEISTNTDASGVSWDDFAFETR